MYCSFVQHKDVLNLKKQIGCIQVFLFSEKKYVVSVVVTYVTA